VLAKKRAGLANLPGRDQAGRASYVGASAIPRTRPDVVGVAVVQHVERLQDRMEPFPARGRDSTIEAAFGRNRSAAFS